MAIVVDNVAIVILEEARFVHNTQVLIREVPSLVLVEDRLVVLIIVEITIAFVGVEVVAFQPVRHGQLAQELHFLGLAKEQVFIGVSTPDSSCLLINQVAFIVH